LSSKTIKIIEWEKKKKHPLTLTVLLDAIKPKETRNVHLLYTAKLHKCKIRLRKNIKTDSGIDLR